MSVEFDSYKFENKIRAMVLDLMNPTARRMIEIQENMEELWRHDNHHKKRIDQLEFNFAAVQSKFGLIDECHKTTQDLKVQNTNFEIEIEQRAQKMKTDVEKAIHKLEDLSMKILTMDESFRNLRAEVGDYANTVNLVKNSIIKEHNKLYKSVEKTVVSIKELWSQAEVRLDKSEFAVLAFTHKSLPKMMADVEANSRSVKEIQKEMQESLLNKVEMAEFLKYKKTNRFEIEKIYEKIQETHENNSKIEKYLTNYMPFETNNAISEAIFKLDARFLRKFVEHDEFKMEEIRNSLEMPALSIAELEKKALDSYNNSIMRRETMKIEVEKAELEEKAAHHRARKRRGSSHEEKRLKKQNSNGESENETEPKIVIENIPEIIEPAKEEVLKSTHPSHLDLREIPAKVPSSVNLVPQIIPPEVIAEEKKEIVETDALAINSEGSGLQNDEASSESLEGIATPDPNYYNYPPIDIAKIDADFEEIRKSFEDFKISTEEKIEVFTHSCQEKIDASAESVKMLQQDIETNLNLIHQEIKQISLKNKQEKIDSNKQISLYHSELRTTLNTIEKVDQQFTSLNELLISLSEIGKILHLLTMQEEEDRQSLQLIGYSESKSQKNYISLKSDCMSCSGQNPVIMTAFKMACLNYSPSSIKYRHKTYTRKQLIHVLGTIANSAWAQSTSKAPRYATEFGSYASIPTLSEDPSINPANKKHRYNKSQFIELPSLNTSKLFLDINDTPIASTKDIKKIDFNLRNN